MKRQLAWTVVGTLALQGGLSFGHHSVPLNFDMERNHTVTGVLVETEWRNPHSHLVLEVVNEDGVSETWLVEWNAINTITRLLRKLDFSIEDFRIGEEITVTGWMGRHDKSIYFREVEFSDGRTFVWQTRLTPAEQMAR